MLFRPSVTAWEFAVGLCQVGYCYQGLWLWALAVGLCQVGCCDLGLFAVGTPQGLCTWTVDTVLSHSHSLTPHFAPLLSCPLLR